MSTTTDNRVVEMRFDNQQFEKNANQSISTLGKLKEALKFDKSSTKGLEDLNRSTKDFNLDSVTQAVDKVSSHFDAMGVVGMTVMNRITNAAIDFGKKAFSAMTGGLTEGFSKYSSKMEAVQVMMINSGEALEDINNLLQDLQYYTDETSYSFGQMVTAMGQFTAANVDLYDAEEMVKGIANWAATAGVGVTQAGRAFNEMSQAIARGALTYEDAKTLNMMNLFTPDFRKLLLSVAAAYGTIRQEGDAFFANVSTGFGKMKEVEVTAENFMTTLKGRWADTDVLTEVLHLYNAASDELSDFDLEILKAAGLSSDFGEKAYDAAYVAKTFADAVGAIKDALSSGWSTTFEYIFGNFKEASETWTLLANAGATLVANIAEARNSVLAFWKEFGGRSYVIIGIIEAVRNLHLLLTAIKVGFDSVFSIDPHGLLNISKGFHDLMISLRPTPEALRTIAKVSAVLFGILDAGLFVVKSLLGIAVNVVGIVFQIISGLASLAAYQLSVIRQNGVLRDTLKAVVNVAKNVSIALAGSVLALIEFIKSFKELPIVHKIIGDIRKAFAFLGDKLSTVIGKIVGAFSSFIESIKKVKNLDPGKVLGALNTVLEKVWGAVEKVVGSIVNLFTYLTGIVRQSGIIQRAFGALSATLKALPSILVGSVTALSNFIKSIKELPIVKRISDDIGKAFKVFGNTISMIMGKIVGAFSSLIDSIKKVKNLDSGKLLESLNGVLERFWNIVLKVKDTVVKFFDYLAGKAGAVKLAVKGLKDVSTESENTKKGISGLADVFSRSNLEGKISSVTNTFKNLFEELKGSKVAIGAVGVAIAGLIAKLAFGSFGGKNDNIGGPLGMLFNIGGMAKKAAIAGAVGGAVALIYKSLQKLQTESDDASKSLSGTVSKLNIFKTGLFKDGLSNPFSGLIEKLTSFRKEVDSTEQKLGFFDRLRAAVSNALDAINSRLTPASNAIKNFFETLTLGKVILGVFAAAVLKNVLIFGGALGTIPFVIFNFNKVLNALTKAINNFAIGSAPDSFGDTCIKIAQSLAILAASMFVLAKIPVDRFSDVSKTMTSILALLGLLAGMDFIITIFGKGEYAGNFGKGIKAVADAIVFVSAAIYILSKAVDDCKIPIENVFAGLAIATAVLTGISVFASKISPIAIELKGSSSLFTGMATSIGTLAVALWKLSTLPKDELWNAAKSMGIALAACTAIIIAMGKFGMIGKAALGSVAPVLAVALAFKIIADSLSSMTNMALGVQHFVDNSGKIAEIFAILGGLFIAIHALQKIFKPVAKDAALMSGALLALSASMAILTGVLVALSKVKEYITDEGIVYGALSLVVVGAALHIAMKGFVGVGKSAAKASLALLAVTGAFTVLAGLGIALSLLPDPAMYFKALGAMVALGAIVSVMNMTASKVKPGAAKPIWAMVASIVAIAGSLLVLTKFGDMSTVGVAAASLGGVLLALAVTFRIISGFKAKKVNTDVLSDLIWALVAIGASLFGIARYNWLQIATAAGGISITLLAFAEAFKIIGSFKTKDVNLKVLAGLIGALAVIGASLYGIARFDWLQIGAAALGMSVVMMSLAGAFKVIGSFKTKAVDTKALGELVIALGVIGASLFGIARYNWAQIGVAALAMSGVLMALVGAYAIIAGGAIKPGGVDTVSLIAMVAALGVIGLSLSAIAQYPWEQIMTAMVAVNATMLVMAGVLAIISGIGTGAGAGAVAGAITFGILAASLIVLAGALKMLEGISFDSIGQGLIVLVGAITLLTALSALFGFVPVLIVGLGALAVAFIAFGAGAIEFGIAANLVTAAIYTFTQALIALGTIGPEMAANITNTLIALGQGIGAGLASIITSFVSTLISGVAQGLGTIVATVVSFVPQLIATGGEILSSLVQGLKVNLPVMASAGSDIINAFINSVKGIGSSLIETGKNLGEFFLNGFRDILGWHSPPAFIADFFGDLISEFAAQTSGALPSLSADGESMGTAIGSSLENTATPFINSLMDKIGHIFDLISQASAGVDAATDEATAYVNSVYDEAKKKEDAKRILAEARRNNAENGDALDNDDVSYEDHKEMERQRKLRSAGWRPSGGETAGSGGSGGGGGGGGGGGASKATEEVKELFDAWKDGGEIIQKVAEKFGDAYATLGYTHPLQLGKDAVEGLANKLYDLSVIGVDAAELAQVTAEDKLASMKELFDDFVSGIQSTLQSAGDAFGGFTENSSESIDDWIRNLKKQEVSIDNWVRHIEQLAARTGDYNLVESFINWGPQEDARLRKLLASPASTIKDLSDSLYAYQDTNMEKLKERTYKIVAAAAATTVDIASDGAKEAATEVEETTAESAENVSNNVTSTAEKTASNYVVVTRNGVSAVINEIGQVIKANGELGQSAFDAAKVTQEALSEAEDAYKTTYDAVYQAVSSGFDFFGKFNKETELTGEDFVEQVEDNIHGWIDMYDGMEQLLNKGVDKGIVERLYSMGDGAWEYVKAMNELGEQEIDKLNSLYSQSQTLAEQLASQLSQDMATAAVMATQGFVNNLDQAGMYEAAKQTAQQFIAGQIDYWKNGGTNEVGVSYAEGAAQSIADNQSTITNEGVQQLNNTVVEWKSEAYGGMYTVYEYGIDGAVAGIKENYHKINEAMHEGDVGLIDDTMEDFDEHSPSKVFAKIGKFLDLGLAQGITDNIRFIESATDASATSAIDSMRAVVGHIADIINGEVQVDPTIRPVMDLSDVEAGASAISSMFGGSSYSMTRGINVQNANSSIGDLISQMMAQQAGMTPATAGSPINMYVYAAPGQSEEDIANIVEQKIMFRINRNGGVWR